MAEIDLNLEDQMSRVANALARPTARTQPEPIEVADVQGLVFRGYGTLRHACYPLLQIQDAARARVWLRKLAPRVSTGQPAARDVALQIAFSHAGLAALGLPEATLNGFSREFIGGMTTPHRSRLLGDDAASHPRGWEWGGPDKPAVHVVLMLYATDADRLASFQEELKRAWSEAGLEQIRILTTAELGRAEHFGFADGISQPAIEGYHETRSALHRLKAGEFLLGYRNEYGLYTERPMVKPAHDAAAILPLDVEQTPRHDLGRNGTYLVFRHLRQDVPAFRQTLDALTQRPDGSPDRAARDKLAAQMVGRWPSGASLIETPERDDSSKAEANEFRYHREDEHGLQCPIGAHVRRANPRDSLPPMPGSAASLQVNRHHRLIRRGRVYGTRLPEGEVDSEDRGLILIVVNAIISRQFEFVQHSWLNDPQFNGLYNDADPIVGSSSNNDFVAPGDPVGTRSRGLPRFVTVAGGGYFFMPGIRALRFLAEMMP